MVHRVIGLVQKTAEYRKHSLQTKIYSYCTDCSLSGPLAGAHYKNPVRIVSYKLNIAITLNRTQFHHHNERQKFEKMVMIKILSFNFTDIPIPTPEEPYSGYYTYLRRSSSQS